MLVRPPMTNLKMAGRADCAVSAYNPLLLSVKDLTSLDASCGGLGAVGWGESASEQMSALPCSCWHLKQNKLSFSPIWPVYWLLSGRQPNCTFR